MSRVLLKQAYSKALPPTRRRSANDAFLLTVYKKQRLTGRFDEEYWNTFNQQNRSDDVYAQTGENSQRQSGMSGQIKNPPQNRGIHSPSNPHDRLSRSGHGGKFPHHEIHRTNEAGRRFRQRPCPTGHIRPVIRKKPDRCRQQWRGQSRQTGCLRYETQSRRTSVASGKPHPRHREKRHRCIGKKSDRTSGRKRGTALEKRFRKDEA